MFKFYLKFTPKLKLISNIGVTLVELYHHIMIALCVLIHKTPVSNRKWNLSFH